MSYSPGEVDSASALRDREERLLAALRASGTCTYRWDLRTGELEWDENLERVLGVAPEDAPRDLDAFLEHVHPDERATVAAAYRRCAAEGGELALEFRVRRPDGGERWVLDRAETGRDAEHRPLYVTGACIDLTGRGRATAPRPEETARADHERLRQARSDFMTVLSHELRTPLTAVIGYAELLEMGIPEPIGPEAQAHVERIHLSAVHLQQLIEEILTFSRLDAGRERASSETVEIPLLLRELAAVVEPVARQKALAFTIHADDAPATLRTDARKLRLILLSLLGNAVKFTHSGGVELRVDASGGGTRFRVRDTGVGIRPEQMHLIYEPFWQGEVAQTRSFGGTGLGLSITRSFVEMLGGEIRVESDVGRGTLFTLILPAASGA